MKIVKYLGESCFMIKRLGETIKNKRKEIIGEFLSMLLGTLNAI